MNIIAIKAEQRIEAIVSSLGAMGIAGTKRFRGIIDDAIKEALAERDKQREAGIITDGAREAAVNEIRDSRLRNPQFPTGHFVQLYCDSVCAEKDSRIAELERAHKLQVQNYIRLVEAVLGGGDCRTCDFTDPVKDAENLHVKIAEKDKEIERLKNTGEAIAREASKAADLLRNETRMYENASAERDTIKSQLAELTNITKKFETVVKDHQYGSDDECEGCGHTQECARNCDINNVLLNFTAYQSKEEALESVRKIFGTNVWRVKIL